MAKKVLKLYLISFIILVLLGLIYTTILYFTQNDKLHSYITLILGGIFFIIFSLMLTKIYKHKLFFVVTLYFIINYSIIILSYFLANNTLEISIIFKAFIYYILSIITTIISKRK